MSQVELTGVTKSFGSYEALRGIDLTIADGEFMVFVGPSGCGKSTLLRLICGLEAPTAGTIRFDGRDMRGVAPAERRLAMVFQSYALYPHMSVADNMGFALRMSGVSKEERAKRVAHAAEILQITRLLERRPKELSGGQRQRVAIGRAIVREPSLFLFDEPLSNLDAELRVDMRYELAELHRRLGTTMIYVTHDQVEAMTMADRIAVLRDGRVEQVGTPLELYERPVNRFVAGFIGSPRMNLLAASVAEVQPRSVGIRLPGADELMRLEMAPRHGLGVGEAVELGIRPEHIDLMGSGFRLPVRVSFCEYVGGSSLVHANAHPAGRLLIRTTDKPAPAIGETIDVCLPERACHLFSSEGIRV